MTDTSIGSGARFSSTGEFIPDDFTGYLTDDVYAEWELHYDDPFYSSLLNMEAQSKRPSPLRRQLRQAVFIDLVNEKDVEIINLISDDEDNDPDRTRTYDTFDSYIEDPTCDPDFPLNMACSSPKHSWNQQPPEPYNSMDDESCYEKKDDQ